MIITLNGTPLNRCNITNFTPQESAEMYTMLAGNKRKAIIAQFDWPLNVTYDLIKSSDFEVVYQIWKTASRIVVSFPDWMGRTVTFYGTISPPTMTKRRELSDGQWLIGQCSFTIDQLE